MPDSSRNSSAAPSLSIGTFEQPSFNVAALLAGLTEDLIKQDKQSGKAFNPDPFIATLEGAVQTLIPLRRQVAQQIKTSEREVLQKEKQYRAKIDDFKNGLESVSRQFSGLDAKITEVGKTAIRIGEQLESIDRVRARASDAHDIILYYNEFARGDTTRLEALRKEGKQGRASVALVIRRLLAVARDVEGVEGGEETRATIEKYAERFEKDMLRLFEKAYLKGEPKGMAHCARTLLDFNGGHSCIQIYVNQHDFFISRERVEAPTSITETPMWEALADPNKPAPRSEPELAELYTDIRHQISQEAQIIEAVFPQPAVVMQVFLQRVFAQVIQTHIEKLIDAAQGSSTLVFLRILALARSSTAKLINDLKSHDFFRSASGVGMSSFESYAMTHDPAAETNEGSKPSKGSHHVAGGVGVAAISSMLDTQLDELFSQHLDNSHYLERESKSLTELYASYLLKYARWHRAINKAKPTNTLFDRMVNQLTNTATQSPGGATAPGVAPAQATGLKSLLKLSGLTTANSTDADADTSLVIDVDAENPLEESDGELNLDVAEKLLMWHAEAVGRMIELTPSSDVPKNVFSLLKTLADNYCNAYVETALESSLAQFVSHDTKLEPDLKPVTAIKAADMAMHLWQRYVTTAIVPLAAASVTIRREMSIFNNHILVRIEGKVNSLAQKCLENVVFWLSHSLSKQKKLDFKPKNDELEFTRIHTEPCVACSDFLNITRDTITRSMSGKNAEGFLTEVGVIFHSLLLEHLKKFPVSAIGGLMLTKDLAMYQDTIVKFNIPALNDRFEMIRELGNIFVVQPSILKSYLTESMLGRIDSKLLRPFLMMRADYGDHSKKFWDEVVGISSNGDVKSGLGNGNTDKGLWLSLTGF
ncbi:exocyst complex component Sec10-like protein [Melampsora americana]|nr:exocyst complex component Sec10-like protein [Melampsora americana]